MLRRWDAITFRICLSLTWPNQPLQNTCNKKTDFTLTHSTGLSSFDHCMFCGLIMIKLEISISIISTWCHVIPSCFVLRSTRANQPGPMYRSVDSTVINLRTHGYFHGNAIFTSVKTKLPNIFSSPYIFPTKNMSIRYLFILEFKQEILNETRQGYNVSLWFEFVGS